MLELEFSSEALALACTPKEERGEDWWERFESCEGEQQALVVASILVDEYCDRQGMLLQRDGLPLSEILARMPNRAVEPSRMHKLLGILSSAEIIRSSIRPVICLRHHQQKQLEDFRNIRG